MPARGYSGLNAPSSPPLTYAEGVKTLAKFTSVKSNTNLSSSSPSATDTALESRRLTPPAARGIGNGNGVLPHRSWSRQIRYRTCVIQVRNRIKPRSPHQLRVMHGIGCAPTPDAVGSRNNTPPDHPDASQQQEHERTFPNEGGSCGFPSWLRHLPGHGVVGSWHSPHLYRARQWARCSRKGNLSY